MNIHWFPGHMTKSLRMIEDNLKLVDAVIYILDARAPKSCLNPSLDKLIQNKPVIYVLNKADLVAKEYLSRAISYFSDSGKSVIALNSTVSKSAAAISTKVKQLCAEKLARAEAKGRRIALRAMVVGIPNGGKSTFINNLSGSGKATTGNKAGVTRGKQWVVVDEFFEVLDTPGTLYPKLDNREKAKRLAYIGSINDDVLDISQLARTLATDLERLAPNAISERYKLPIAAAKNAEILERKGDNESDNFVGSDKNGESDEFAGADIYFDGIAKSRGFIKKGGVLDVEKAAVALIDDFRKGRLGKIALEVF